MCFTPMKRGWAEKVLAMLKGEGGITRFWVVFTHKLEVLAILNGGCKKFPLFKSLKV